MLQAIAILGGWLLMMGQHDRSESLFYYFRIEDQVPQNHLLRFIDRYVSFDFVREKLRASYSETGRPSIDPEVLLRILLLGYLYGNTSERKLLEELRMHLAWRWFTGLGSSRRFPITRRSRRTGMAAFRSRTCFRSCLSALWSSASPRVWWRASRCRSMAASSWRTRATTVVSPANSSRRPRK